MHLFYRRIRSSHGQRVLFLWSSRILQCLFTFTVRIAFDRHMIIIERRILPEDRDLVSVIHLT
jgi:hypothetical protein